MEQTEFQLNAVTVTAADFNGKSFDGCPFNFVPTWLHNAIKSKTITGVNPNSTDYLVWAVTTNDGIVNAEPGDVILNTDGIFSVIKYERS